MSTLQRLQQALQDQILHGDCAQLPLAFSGTAIGAPERVYIYATAYRLRLLEALQTDYTGLHAALGDTEFEHMAYAYIATHPSHQANLRWFGAHLSDFLTRATPYAAMPVLSELGLFEWSMGLAFDAPDQTCLVLPDLAAVPGASWGEMGFAMHASVRCLALHSNAALIWKAVSQGQTPPSPAYTDEALTWLIWRKDLSVFFRSVTADEAWALTRIREGDSFAQICEGLCAWVAPDEAAQRAASLLKTWVEDQLIQRLVSP